MSIYAWLSIVSIFVAVIGIVVGVVGVKNVRSVTKIKDSIFNVGNEATVIKSNRRTIALINIEQGVTQEELHSRLNRVHNQLEEVSFEASKRDSGFFRNEEEMRAANLRPGAMVLMKVDNTPTEGDSK